MKQIFTTITLLLGLLFLTNSSMAQLAGTYTIDAGSTASSTNYKSFSDLFEDLNFGTRSDGGTANGPGVSAAVTANVVAGSGPYNEQALLHRVPSITSTNTLTINGNGEEINYAPTTTTEPYILRFDTASYITLKNLKVDQSGPAIRCFAIHFMGKATNNLVSKCVISSDTTTGSGQHNGILFNNAVSSYSPGTSESRDNVVDSCEIEGFSVGVFIIGASTYDRCYNNTVSNTTFRKQYLGVYSYFADKTTLSHNHLSDASEQYSNYYSLVVQYGDSCHVVGNISNATEPIDSAVTIGLYLGITKNCVFEKNYLRGNQYPIVSQYDTLSVFKNNQLIIVNNVDLYAGIGNVYFIACDRTKIYHNSVSNNSIFGQGFTVTFCNRLDIRNNSFAYTGSDSGYAIYFTDTTSIGTFDYNNFYNAGSKFAFYVNEHADLTSLQGEPGPVQNLASKSGDPNYFSTLDLHASGTQLRNIGDNSVGVLEDYDCQTRPSGGTVDIGIDEFGDGLPVEMGDFIATKVDNTTLLEWNTLSEINNEKFEILHSTTGSQFVKIGEVLGAGTTSEEKAYSFVDALPKAGLNYYQLRQVDFDGAETYSEVRVVEFGTITNEISISPNPFNDQLNVSVDMLDAGEVTISLVNVLGEEVLRTTMEVVEGRNSINLELSDLTATGVYYLTIEAEGSSVTTKLIRAN